MEGSTGTGGRGELLGSRRRQLGIMQGDHDELTGERKVQLRSSGAVGYKNGVTATSERVNVESLTEVMG